MSIFDKIVNMLASVSYQVNMLFDEKAFTDMPLGISLTLILLKYTRSVSIWWPLVLCKIWLEVMQWF